MVSQRSYSGIKLGADTISTVLFFLLTSFTFIFNYNESSFLGIPAYSWVNIFIVLFITFMFLRCMKSGGKIAWDRTFKWPILFIIICFISIIYSYATNDTVDRCRRMLIMLALMLAVFQFVQTSEENLVRGLKVFIWSGFLASIYLFMHSNVLREMRIGRAIGDPNLVGFTFVFACTMAIHFFKEEKSKLYIFPIVSMGAAIILTGSRASFGLLIAAIVANVYLTAYQRKWNILKVTFITLIIGGVVVWGLYLVMNVPVLYNVLGMRLLSFYQITHGMQSVYNESSTQTRMIFIQRGFEWFLNSPFLLGHGINSFPSYNATFSIGWYSFSHCDYIEILSGVGIPGFIFFFAPYLTWIKDFFKRGESKNQKYKILMLSLVIEFLLGEIFLCTYYEKGTWILFALLAALGRVSEDKLYEEGSDSCE